MSQLARTSLPEYTLTVLNGAEKGTTFKLVAGKVSIGRSSENDISFKDDTKMSRNHAVIQIAAHGAEISSVSDRNKVIVNGDIVSTAFLPAGAIIQLGDTKFQYKIVSDNLPKLHDPADSLKPQHPRGAKGGPSRLNFYIIVGLVGLLGFWLFSSQNDKKITSIRNEQDVETAIDGNRKIIEKNEAERKQMGLNTPQYAEAQPNFIKGFRDYRKGQYERAIESFQACLSLFPQHIQCKTYLDRSAKKFSELVQYHMILANKYRAQNQFSACKSAYRNVMVMLKNTGDKTYKEAQSGYAACESLEGVRY